MNGITDRESFVPVWIEFAMWRRHALPIAAIGA
jgi:hypothetical protein